MNLLTSDWLVLNPPSAAGSHSPGDISLLRHHLKRIGVTPELALQELASMYKVYLRDKENTFALSRIVTLTKKQERILKTISPKLLAEKA